ncbi:MAG: hypothetical protein IT304_07010 [Dehalococcoidia bacterium]|nr:hypothetical protein [Dehalococcoidia bacterium]
MKPLVGGTLCLVHDPSRAADQARARAAGGLASGEARRQKLSPADIDWVSLHNRSAVQAVLEGVLRFELLGQLPPERSRLIVRILSAAIRNFGPHPPPGDLGYLPDMKGYTFHREEFAAAADDILYTVHDAESARQYEAISHESSRRTQRYRDEDNFGRGPEGPFRPLTPADARTLCAPFDESLINPPLPTDRPPDARQAQRDALWGVLDTIIRETDTPEAGPTPRPPRSSPLP